MKKYSNIVFLMVIILFIALFTKIIKKEELRGGYVNLEKLKELESNV